MILRARPIYAEAFSDFGDLIEAGPGGHAANQGTARRQDFTTPLKSYRPDATPNLALFCAAAQPYPLALRLLERHPASSQLFVPMKAGRYVIVLAPSNEAGEPAWSKITAFVCGPGQAVNYRPGTWHHPILAIDEDATFLMLSWENGSAGDCEERALPEAITVEV